MLAHIAGMPFEEWVTPLAAAGSGMAVAMHAAIRRLRRSARAIQPAQCAADESGTKPLHAFGITWVRTVGQQERTS